MQRLVRGLACVIFALVGYFIFSNIVRHWVYLPAPGKIGFVLAFTLFALLHAATMLGWRRALLFFVLTALISLGMEELGVATGLIFGRYHYSDMLGPKLAYVPVIIPLGWFMMNYSSWVVAQGLLRGTKLRGVFGVIALSLTAALVMTGWDMVMDPPMTAAKNWIWEDGGSYFGVPPHNYFGWVLNSFLVYAAFGIADRLVGGRDGVAYRFGDAYAALPAILYVLFGIVFLVPGRQEPLIVIAVFTMLFPGALGLARLVLPAKRAER